MAETLRIIADLAVGLGAGAFYSFFQNRKYRAECERIENENRASLIEQWKQNIHNPMKAELNELKKFRKDVQRMLYSLTRCPDYGRCPIHGVMQDIQRDREDKEGDDDAGQQDEQ